MLENLIDTLRKRGINPYQATIMASKEAEIINKKIFDGIIHTNKKPTTLALEKLMDGRIINSDEEDMVEGN